MTSGRSGAAARLRGALGGQGRNGLAGGGTGRLPRLTRMNESVGVDQRIQTSWKSSSRAAAQGPVARRAWGRGRARAAQLVRFRISYFPQRSEEGACWSSRPHARARLEWHRKGGGGRATRARTRSGWLLRSHRAPAGSAMEPVLNGNGVHRAQARRQAVLTPARDRGEHAADGAMSPPSRRKCERRT